MKTFAFVSPSRKLYFPFPRTFSTHNILRFGVPQHVEFTSHLYQDLEDVRKEGERPNTESSWTRCGDIADQESRERQPTRVEVVDLASLL